MRTPPPHQPGWCGGPPQRLARNTCSSAKTKFAGTQKISWLINFPMTRRRRAFQHSGQTCFCSPWKRKTGGAFAPPVALQIQLRRAAISANLFASTSVSPSSTTKLFTRSCRGSFSLDINGPSFWLNPSFSSKAMVRPAPCPTI